MCAFKNSASTVTFIHLYAKLPFKVKGCLVQFNKWTMEGQFTQRML